MMNTTTNFINCVVCCCKHIYTPHQNFGYQYQTNIHSSSFFWLIFTNTSTQFISIVISHCKHIYTTLYSSFFFITNTSIHLLSIVLNNIKHIQGAIFFCYFFTNFRSFFWKYHDNTSQIMLLDFVFDKLLLKKTWKRYKKAGLLAEISTITIGHAEKNGWCLLLKNKSPTSCSRFFILLYCCNRLDNLRCGHFQAECHFDNVYIQS